MLVLRQSGYHFNNVERAAGSTKWNFKSLFSYALEGIFSFSTAPLKIAGIFGVILLLVQLFYRYIQRFQH